MNTLYPSARERFLTKRIHWLNETIVAALVTPGYVYDDSHVFLVSVPPITRLSLALVTARTATAGWANGECRFTDADVTEANAVVLFKDTGDSANSPLIAYYDEGFGLPATKDGSYNFIPIGLGYFRL